MMMRRLIFIENLKNFLITKPPVVLFLFCLISFIIVLSSFMEFIAKNNVKNPDELDWNVFRSKMAEIDFCFKFPFDEKTNIDYLVNLNDKNKKTYSYPVSFVIEFSRNRSELNNLKYLIGDIDGYLIGLEKEKFNANLYITDYSLIYDDECTKILLSGKSCYKYTVNGCMMLSGFSKFFKKTKSPNLCPKKYFNEDKFNTSQVNIIPLIAYKETPDLAAQFYCPTESAIKAKINYTKDPSLIPFLTIADKELIHKNLKIIVICLSLLITVIVLFGMFTSSRKKSSSVYFSTVN